MAAAVTALNRRGGLEGKSIMKMPMLSSVAAAAFAVAVAAAPAAAQDQCPIDLTTGQCIAGLLYGNISNPRPDGPGVLPSLAPGPWACVSVAGTCQGDETDAGVSVGDVIGNGKSDFANGKDPGPGFGK